MSRPNFILLTTTAHKADSVGYTPHLASLCRHGMYFPQAICTTPIAMPARASLLSALLPSVHGVSGLTQRLPSSLAPLTRALHVAGYLMGAFGNLSFEGDPADFGLDRFGEIPEHTPNAVVSTGDAAVRFLQSARPPFFMWINFPGSHVPDPIDHFANLMAMDSQIGRILATVLGRGHSNNVIAYTSEHGWSDAGDMDPSSESWLRVPLILSGPIVVRRGETDDAPAQLTDLLPTFAHAAGLEVPRGLHGVSLLPRLANPAAPVRAAACAELPGGLRVARTARFKLVESREEARTTFFDLRNDGFGRENIYGNTATILHQVEMTKVLRRVGRG